MVFLSEYGLFLLKTVTLVIAVLITLAGIIALSAKEKEPNRLKLTKLNDALKKNKESLLKHLLDKKALKAYKSDNKAKDKKEAPKPRLFVIDFKGDLKASRADALSHEVSGILQVANDDDTVLVKIESPGGVVNGYGFAASQLVRIRDRGLTLIASVDKVAASGGYLMASVANEIIAAPFAFIGSIGVVAQLPNFHRLLKKKDIDVELLTAGQYKRTLTMFGENTEEGREKFQQDLEDIHRLFKGHIHEYRANVNIEDVATGEHWLAGDALSRQLVDSLMTSDAFIEAKLDSHEIIKIEYKQKTSKMDKLLKPVAALFMPYA